MSIKDYAELRYKYAQSNEIKKDFQWIQTLLWDKVTHMPVDYPENRSQNIARYNVHLTSKLSVEETQQLNNVVKQQTDFTSRHVVFTALVRVFQKWCQQDTILLDIQSHGRNIDIPGADLTRTVGYFTEMIAQPISADRQLSFKESLKRFQSQLDNTFLKSKNYGLLRYISEDQEISQKMKQLPKPEIGLNFMPEQTGDRDESSPLHVIEFPNYENDKIW